MTADEIKAWAPIIGNGINFLGTVLAVVVGGILTHMAMSRRDRRSREIEGREWKERLWIEYQLESLRAL